MKKRKSLLCCALLCVSIVTGCGGKNADVRLEGSCIRIMEQMYADANLTEELRLAMDNFETGELNEEIVEYMIGTEGVEYTDSAYSVPVGDVMPYQCVILRLASGQDIGEAMEMLSQNADPRKWICEEAESVAVENVGDVVLVVLGDTENVTAVREAFLGLAE